MIVFGDLGWSKCLWMDCVLVWGVVHIEMACLVVYGSWEKRERQLVITRLKFAMHPRSASDTTEQSSRTSFLHQRVSFVAHGHETLKKVHYSLLFHDNGATCMFMHFLYHMTIRQAHHGSRWWKDTCKGYSGLERARIIDPPKGVYWRKTFFSWYIESAKSALVSGDESKTLTHSDL